MAVTAIKQDKARSIPTPESLVERARAMIPALKERGAKAEADRKIPEETIREFKEAGFFDILKPKRWGGFEMDPRVFYQVQMAIAEGCMSSAWVYGVIGVHPYQLGLFDGKAQDDVWSKDQSILISSSYQPVGKVERVDGGFKLSGQWGFSSGCEHCDWTFLGAMIPPAEAGGPPDMRTFLLPRSDYKIIDKWHTFGLKGTGSQDILVEDAFVPEHRTHRGVDGFMCNNPGQAENTGDIFKLPWAQIFVRAVSTASIGAARGALTAYLDVAAKRVSTNTGKASKSDPFAQMSAAKTRAELDEMCNTIDHNFEQMLSAVREGREISIEDRMLYRYQSSCVSRRCAELVDALVQHLGGKAVYLDSPIIRYWLDLNAARAHVANTPTLLGVSLGAKFLGEDVKEFFI